MEVQIANNDVVIGTSDAQHQLLLLLVAKGGFKESPTATVGAQNYLESEDPADFLREVRLRFSHDGCNISDLNFDDNTKRLNISASYAN
ncbi:hypothetical protein D6B99_11670 [Arachidicoccus soli]|uniref:Uncharacterized protein n=2 Tax=Arachidicoccus soli TaxID=2341117 RepID=A0A386HRK7_9BACT|nr:hypothetical protein D6B99_11670 [Arachidicoccus soli]